MGREARWVILILCAIVAGIFGMYLSVWASASLSGPGQTLFILLMLGIVVGIVVWSLSGNKRVQVADSAATAAALMMQPAPGKAAIYILRKGFVGMAQGFNFTIEGVTRGQARGNTFLHAEVDPGAYRITAKGKGNEGETEVTVSAGEVVVLKVAIEVGLIKGNIAFDRIEGDAARRDLGSVKMACWEA